MAAKAHFEELLNAVAETLGVDTDEPALRVLLDQGIITCGQNIERDREEVASAAAGRLDGHDR